MLCVSLCLGGCVRAGYVDGVTRGDGPTDAGPAEPGPIGSDGDMALARDASVLLPPPETLAPPAFTTSSKTFVDVPQGDLTVPLSPGLDWLVLFSGRLSSTSVQSFNVEVRYLVDGIERGIGGVQVFSSSWGPWQHFMVLSGKAAPQKIQLQLRDGAGTGTAQDLRVVAFPVPPGADLHHAEQDATRLVPDGEAHRMGFTPSAAGSYLVLALVNAEDTNGGDVTLWFTGPDGSKWPPLPFTNGRRSWQSFFAARVVDLTPTPQTVGLEVNTYASGTNDDSQIANARFVALRVGAFPAVYSAEDAAQHVTSGTAEVKSPTLSLPLNAAAGRYLVIQSAAVSATPATTLSERVVRFLLNGAELLSVQLETDHTGFRPSFGVFTLASLDPEDVLENAYSSPTGDPVDAVESVIHLVRLP